jgi:hypothetical protein
MDLCCVEILGLPSNLKLLTDSMLVKSPALFIKIVLCQTCFDACVCFFIGVSCKHYYDCYVSLTEKKILSKRKQLPKWCKNIVIRKKVLLKSLMHSQAKWNSQYRVCKKKLVKLANQTLLYALSYINPVQKFKIFFKVCFNIIFLNALNFYKLYFYFRNSD